MDFDLSTSITLVPNNTNIADNWTPTVSTATTISGYDAANGDTGKSYDPGDVYYEGTGDEHYHVGNYYQWSAATAGYTGTIQSTQSICPAGWTLPSVPQFRALISSGLSSSNFMNAPYYLLCGGNLYNSSLDATESLGRYWSSTPDSSGSAYHLLFFPDTSVGSEGGVGGIIDGGVDVYQDISRYYGLSVRCIAAG